MDWTLYPLLLEESLLLPDTKIDHTYIFTVVIAHVYPDHMIWNPFARSSQTFLGVENAVLSCCIQYSYKSNGSNACAREMELVIVINLQRVFESTILNYFHYSHEALYQPQMAAVKTSPALHKTEFSATS